MQKTPQGLRFRVIPPPKVSEALEEYAASLGLKDRVVADPDALDKVYRGPLSTSAGYRKARPNLAHRWSHAKDS